MESFLTIGLVLLFIRSFLRASFGIRSSAEVIEETSDERYDTGTMATKEDGISTETSNEGYNPSVSWVNRKIESILDNKRLQYQVSENNQGYRIRHTIGDKGIYIYILIDKTDWFIVYQAVIKEGVPDNKIQKINELLHRANCHLGLGRYNISYEARAVYYDLAQQILDCPINETFVENCLAHCKYAAELLLPIVDDVIIHNVEPIIAIMDSKRLFK